MNPECSGKAIMGRNIWTENGAVTQAGLITNS